MKNFNTFVVYAKDKYGFTLGLIKITRVSDDDTIIFFVWDRKNSPVKPRRFMNMVAMINSYMI